MKLRKKSQQESKDKSLYPVLYVMESLKDYHRILVQGEVDSLNELSLVSKSFEDVLEDSEGFRGTLEDF